jgi:hypothetical protein
VTEQAIPLGKKTRSARASASGTSGSGLQLHAGALDFGVRAVGAMLALAVATVHVADQGGIMALAAPHWIGWGYRAIEIGGVLTALVLLVPQRFLPGPAWLRWAAALLLGVGPFIGYLASRTIGLPGDASDVGNWDYWVGTVSLLIEAALIMLSISMVRAFRRP